MSHRSETNRFVEKAIRRVKERKSAELLQADLDEKWWTNSMECYCHLRNIQDLLSDGKSAYAKRIGMSLSDKKNRLMQETNITLFLRKIGQKIKKCSKGLSWRVFFLMGKSPYERRFGIRNTVWCNGRISHHFCERHIETTSICTKKVFPSFLLDCVLYAGGESGKETLSQTLKNWNRWNAFEISPPPPRRLNIKEVLTPMKVTISYSHSQMEQSKFLKEINV